MSEGMCGSRAPVGWVLRVCSLDPLIQSPEATLWSPLLDQIVSSGLTMLENPGHPRNAVSPANFLFQCILESAQTLLLGGRHRQLITLSVVDAKVQSERLCSQVAQAW